MAAALTFGRDGCNISANYARVRITTHFSNAWIRYGEKNFECVVAELCKEPDLIRLEQSWITETRCHERRFGFNVCAVAGLPSPRIVKTWEGFIDPDGQTITICNLHAFCRANKLDFPSMHRLFNGQSKLKSYRGWTHPRSVRKRSYTKTYEGFIDPAGNVVPSFVNLAAFCRLHKLEKTHMVAVLGRRICSHRGWTHTNGRRRSDPKSYLGFVSPTGERTGITNLAAFCRERGLNAVHMHNVKSGLRRSHKGWTWRASDE